MSAPSQLASMSTTAPCIAHQQNDEVPPIIAKIQKVFQTILGIWIISSFISVFFTIPYMLKISSFMAYFSYLSIFCAASTTILLARSRFSLNFLNGGF
jgi:hypothetical protein